MDSGGRRKLEVDLEDLATAFENGISDLSYYLDLETGAVVMISDETRRALEQLYAELATGAEVDEAILAAALQRHGLAEWERAALAEADRVERGFGTRYAAVPRDEARDAYGDKEEFIATVRDARLRERLADAIGGRGAFGRFRRVLAVHEDERARWSAFRDARLRERMVAWLEDAGIEPLSRPLAAPQSGVQGVSDRRGAGEDEGGARTALGGAPIFSIGNHHTAAADTPPCISDEDPAVYRGYFENACGEQAIFLYERASGRATLYLGDAGWEQPHAVHDGAVSGLMLSSLEQMWLQACWRAARGGRSGR